MTEMTGVTVDNNLLGRFFRHVTPVSVVDDIISLALSDTQVQLYVGVNSFWEIVLVEALITITAPDGRVGEGATVAQALANLS